MYLKVKQPDGSWTVTGPVTSLSWRKEEGKVVIQFVDVKGEVYGIVVENEAYILNEQGTTLERVN